MRRITPRPEWGARHDNGNGVRRLPATQAWLHHTVTLSPDLVPPFDDEVRAMRQIEAVGEARFGRGISYTRLIFASGNVYEGHSIDRIGSHTAGRNSVAVGYSLVGNYEVDRPTEAMLDATAWAMAHDFLNGGIDAADLDGGHRDLKATACPGRHAYAFLGDIDRRAKAHVEGALALGPAAGGRRTLRFIRDNYMRGDDVADLQRILVGAGLLPSTRYIDGIFGPATLLAVVRLQQALNVPDDGIVGPRTYAAIDALLAFLGGR